VTAATDPDVSVVILTRGDRPAPLRAAVESALDQRGVDVDVVVVANGAPPASLGLPEHDRVRVIAAAENLGIPAGRNLGARRATAALLAFLDDDARYAGVDILARAANAFRADPRLGAIAQRLVDEQGVTARRHVPRIGARHPDRSGPVTAFLGGAVLLRREAFEDARGYAGEFVYAMEETDLALRLIDRGWTIHYDGTPAVFHPRTDPTRHRGAVEQTMRNRVWLAYRNLPVPLAAGYVADWLVLSLLREPRSASALARGVRAGWRTRPKGQRAPIRWRTVAHLTRLGRPPIV
jgi:GT2 family glycosyltransferase